MPKFTIYLIKKEYKNIERYRFKDGKIKEDNHSIFDRNVIIENNPQVYNYLENKDIEPKIINKTTRKNIYYRNFDSHKPWWKDFWKITDDIKIQTADLIVVKEIQDRILVITHGRGRIYINPFAIEYNFGLRTALNMLDSSKIKNTDLFTPSELAISTQLKVGKEAKINDLGIDIYNNLLKTIAGKVKKEYKQYFYSVEGSDSIKFNFSGMENDFDSLIQDLLEIYKLETYKKTGFEWIDFFRPIKDEDLLTKLFKLLTDEINKRNLDILLTYPIHFDDTQNIYFSYNGFYSRQRSMFPLLEIQQYYCKLDEKKINNISIQNLKNHRIDAINYDDKKTYDSQSVFHCLYFETCFKGSNFFFESGRWYKVDDSFTAKIEENYKKIIQKAIDFEHKYNHTLIESKARKRNCNKELIYNEQLVEKLSENGDAYLFDTNLVNYRNSRTEFCDVFFKTKDGQFLLIHNKYKYGSSALSHLFSQGIVSAEFLCDLEYRNIINSKHDTEELYFQEPFNREKVTIVYGIITKRNRSGNFSIPLFSKINIQGFISNLERMNYKARISFIEYF